MSNRSLIVDAVYVYQHAEGPVVELQAGNGKKAHFQLSPALAERLLRQLLLAMVAQPDTAERAKGFYNIRAFSVSACNLDKVDLATEFPLFTRHTFLSIEQAEKLASDIRTTVDLQRGGEAHGKSH